MLSRLVKLTSGERKYTALSSSERFSFAGLTKTGKVCLRLYCKLRRDCKAKQVGSSDLIHEAIGLDFLSNRCCRFCEGKAFVKSKFVKLLH